MQTRIIRLLTPVLVILLITTPACNLPGGTAVPASSTPGQDSLIPIAGPLATATAMVPPATVPATSTVPLIHTMTPADSRGGKLIYDVESAGTALEKRAPYGDSYDLNRLERPFTQDMSYIAGLDIVSFTVAKDNDWWYVSMELTDIDPNSTLDVNYGVELDLDRDGFGDYLLWAHPPYLDQWETVPVQIFQDQNHNTGGISGGKSDAPVPFATDGYETLIFDGMVGGEDPDLAWVRVETGSPATIQFAFKRSWSGSIFMLGVIADAGWKDPKKLDYVDRLSIAEAGSPVKENENYPLKSLALVDNTCREAFGFQPSSYEPQLCPILVPPSRTPAPSKPGGSSAACQPSPNCHVWDSANCRCLQ